MKIIINWDNRDLDAYCDNKCEGCPIRFICYTQKKPLHEWVLSNEQIDYLLKNHHQWLADALSNRRRYNHFKIALGHKVATSRHKVIKEFLGSIP